MTDLVVAFLLGPIFFFPRLLSFSTTSISEIHVFITSGLGTTFWAIAIGAISGVSK